MQQRLQQNLSPVTLKYFQFCFKYFKLQHTAIEVKQQALYG